MLIKQTKEMTESERLAAENSNNLFLQSLCDELGEETDKSCEEINKKLDAGYADGGFIDVDGITWFYEKWNNGIAKLWCTVTAIYVNSSVLLKQGCSFPFEFVVEPMGFATINEWSNTTNDFGKNAKVKCATNRMSVLVHNSSGGFSSTTTGNVAVQIVGRWK